jgi:transcriptional regulator with PAS, ATPase and Fis domain
MFELRAYIRKVAQSDANVLITGETGTGKERVAASIHAESRRRSQPFVSINCAAIPDSLFESELFGFNRGAFTGAQEAQLGKLRSAQGGTFLFDEIGEMNLGAQAKVLRVLENREVFPLGAPRVAAVDLRFIAASNVDLEPLVSQNRFRRDLYYRLNVARLQLLPLREHKEDIPELIGHYVKEFNQRYNFQVEKPTQEVLDRLMDYDWPGNVRELRNLVEVVFIDPPKGSIALSDLPPPFRRLFGGQLRAVIPERERLMSALYQTNWNKTKAAAQLKWSRMNLYRKLSKYHIVQPPNTPSEE